MLQIVPNPAPFWIIWNPNGPTPPRVQFDSLAEAEKAAKNMARLHPGQEFYVMQMAGKATMPPTPEPTFVKAAETKPAADQFDILKKLEEAQENQLPQSPRPWYPYEPWEVPYNPRRPRYL